MLDSPISIPLRGSHPTSLQFHRRKSSACSNSSISKASSLLITQFKMPESSHSMDARVGRANQRYGTSGERLVAGVVALSDDKYYVLLVQSNNGRNWVLPKGGWELDEATAQEAACREAWEEAGAKCSVVYDLGVVIDKRKVKENSKDKEGNDKVKALYHWFEAKVDKLETTWPEMSKRNRTWMTFAQAEQALADRPELLEALRRSTIIRG